MSGSHKDEPAGRGKEPRPPRGSTRAVLIERLGPPEVLVERDVPLAPPGPGDVHLAVRASGVNFADLLQRAGLYGVTPPRPFSPGFEVAGSRSSAPPAARRSASS